MKKATEQLGRFVPSEAQSSEDLQPGDGAFDFLTSFVPSLVATILCDVLRFAITGMRSNELGSVVGQFFREFITVIGLVADHTLRQLRSDHEIEKALNQRTLVRTGDVCVHRDRQALSIHQDHDFYAFSRLGTADAVTSAAIHAKRAIGKTLIQPKAVALFNAATGLTHDLLKKVLAHPGLKPAVHRALSPKAARQVLSFRAIVQHPEDSPYDLSLVGRRPTTQRISQSIKNPFQQPPHMFFFEF